MIQLHWTHFDLVTHEDVTAMLKLYKQTKPTAGAFDTETTGLHIINDKPFVFAFGWIDPPNGYTFVLDLEQRPRFARSVVNLWQTKCASKLQLYLGHHIVYDLHMMANYGLPYSTENMSDTMFYIRYAHDAKVPKEGGPVLGLKPYATQYIDRSAAGHEHLLNEEKQAISARYNQLLQRYLGKQWTAKRIDTLFKDKIIGINAFTPEEYAAYEAWRTIEVPLWLRERIDGRVTPDDIPYNHLNRTNIVRYAHQDIVLTLEVYYKLAPIVEVRQNTDAILIENSLILPIWEMERTGFAVDKAYLEQARQKMYDYILELRQSLQNQAGQPLKIGQSKVILELLRNKFGLELTSSNNEHLMRVLIDLKHDSPGHPGIEFIETIQELRSLEKWYTAYIIRFLTALKNCDRLYTQINQVGTVSGRVTSDFQQFPKTGLKKRNGELLYYPRQIVTVTGGDYDGLVYIDYSQIELRLQAMYTILVGHPEPNLCRAYMPLNCRDAEGVLFNYNDPEHIQAWNTKDWFLCEQPETKWTPIDVHTASTCLIFNITPDHSDFHKLRAEGKRYNFMKNYGGSFARVKAMYPSASNEDLVRINEVYYIAFPGVKTYHQFCYNLAQAQSYATNLFGIRYYGVSGHHLINRLIQGSGAFLLKLKIRELYDYQHANNIKSLMQMNIHDELCWEKHKDEGLEVFQEYKRIMEDWPDTLIPIVSELSLSHTTWAEKKEVSL